MSSQSKILCDQCVRGLSIAQSITPISPTPDLLHSNRPPSESQEHLIRESLSRVKSGATELDSEIERLQDVLDKLRDKKSALDMFTKDHEAIISPIRRIPPEIWSSIFIFCSASASSPRVNLYCRIPNASSQLVPVCSLWKDIAIATPGLWSKLAFAVDTEQMTSLHRDRLHTWIERSGKHPLDIRIRRASDLWVIDFDKCYRPLVDLIVPLSNRWRIVDFILPIGPMRCFTTAKTRFSSLRELRLINNTHMAEPSSGIEEPLNSFFDAPLLTTFVVGNYMDLYGLKVPWAQISAFRIVLMPEDPFYYPLDMCLEVLDQARNLVSCQLFMTHSELPKPRPIICLQSLRTLQISEGARSFSLLNHISLPALLHLVYDLLTSNSLHSDFTSLLSFLSRSSPSLETLSLRLPVNSISDEQLIECLSLVPNLKVLSLGGGPRALSNAFFSRLTCHVHSICIVPKLEVLKFAGGYMDFDYDAFVEMITSRWRSNDHCLTRVVFSPSLRQETLDPEIEERLQDLKDHGMLMDVRFENSNVYVLPRP